MATEVVAPTISAELAARAEYFDHMLNMIPVAYYYPTEPVNPDDGKYVHNKKASVGQLSQGKKKRKGAPTSVQDETKEAGSVKRTRSEKRQDLFDPSNYRTVLSIQQAALAVAPVQPKKVPVAPAAQPPVTPTETKSTEPSTHTIAGSIDELRSRLHKKISQLSNKRQQAPTKQDNLKKKQQLRKKAQQAKTKTAAAPAAVETLAPEPPAPKAPAPKKAAPEPAVETEIPIDFTFSELKTTDKKKKFQRKRETAARALAKAEKYNEYVATLEREDPEKAKEVKKKHAIQASLKRVQGIAVKDNVGMLKKSIKKAEKSKKKSAKVWGDRATEIAEATKARQIQRQENLKNRAQNTKKAIKRKNRPGFEGSAGFLN